MVFSFFLLRRLETDMCKNNNNNKYLREKKLMILDLLKRSMDNLKLLSFSKQYIDDLLTRKFDDGLVLQSRLVIYAFGWVLAIKNGPPRLFTNIKVIKSRIKKKQQDIHKSLTNQPFN